MKVIKHTFPEHPELAILPLADWHIGDPNADGKRMLEWLDYLKNNPNAYAILNGDLMDAAIKTSIGDVYQASIQPMEQLIPYWLAKKKTRNRKYAATIGF